MKLKTTFYWITTALIALETFAGGYIDLTQGRTSVFSGPHVTDILNSLGYPLYVLTILGVWKIPGAITIVAPGFLRLKEWAYAGIVFDLSAAVASHAFCGHRQELVAPTVLLSLALASWALRPAHRILGAHLLSAGGWTPAPSSHPA
ncbi:MAG: DoxX family protein [Terracidiphilus sp.]